MVEAVGADVTYLKPGDHVIGCLSVFCGACSQCTTGHTVLCENTEVKMTPGMSRRLSWQGGQPMHQFLNLSAFAEQLLVHENALVKIDPEIPLDRATLVGCGVITGVGAVFNTARIEAGSTVAVIGCGGVGLSAVNGAALAGRLAHHRHRPAAIEAGPGPDHGRDRYHPGRQRRRGGAGEGADRRRACSTASRRWG